MAKENMILYFSFTAGGVLVIALFLHTMVIFLLRKVQKGATNQKLLITNLSASDLLFIPPGIVYYFRALWTTEGTLSYELSSVAFAAFAVNCYLANLFMILDRTIAGLKPLRYRALLTGRRVKVIAMSLWVPFLFVPIPYVIYGFESFVRILIIFTLLLDFGMIVIGVFCYAFVFVAIKNRTKTFQRGGNNRDIKRASARQCNKILKVAIPILLSFIVFVTLPDIISLVLTLKNIDPQFYRKILYTFPCLNIVLDPLLFLYQYPPLTAQFLKILRPDRNAFMDSSSKVECLVSSSSCRPKSMCLTNRQVSSLGQGQFFDTRM